MSAVKVAHSAEQIFCGMRSAKKLRSLDGAQRWSEALSFGFLPPLGEQRESNTKRNVIKAAQPPRRAGCWCWCLRLLLTLPAGG